MPDVPFRPLHGCVLVRPIPDAAFQPTDVAGLAGQAKELLEANPGYRLANGTVVAVGPGSFNPVTGLTGPVVCAVGDRVVYRLGSAIPVKHLGHNYALLNQLDLLGIVE